MKNTPSRIRAWIWTFNAALFTVIVLQMRMGAVKPVVWMYLWPGFAIPVAIIEWIRYGRAIAAQRSESGGISER